MKNKEEKVINGEVHVYCEEYNELIPKYKHNDTNGLDYELDTETFTYLPMIKQPEYEEEDYLIGFYGRAREKFLKENYGGYYTMIRGSFKLQPHLVEIDKTAYDMDDALTAEFAKAEGVTEELKKADMFEWVGRKRNIQNRVREIVLNEIVYIDPYTNEKI